MMLVTGLAYAAVTETDEFFYTNNCTFYKNSAYTSNSMVITNGQTSTNFLVPNVSWAVGLAWGRLYISTTNNVNQVAQLAWYENSDYNSSNMFWLASMTFTNTSLVSTNVSSAISTCVVANAGGFSTNNLIWFGTSNQFNRVKAITNNTLYMWNNFAYGEASNAIIAKVIEFGGFTIIDGDSSSNWEGQINFTQPVTNCTITGSYRYKR